MVNRSKPRAISLRTHVSWQVYDAINRRTCLHIDAWLYQSTTGTYYFIIRTAAAQMEIGTAYFRADPTGGLVAVQRPDGLDAMALCYIDSPRERTRAPWLEAVHWRDIYPLLRAPREGFKAPASVLLHYVYTSPGVSDPTAGLENMYAVTGLAGRDAARVSAGGPVYRPDSTPKPRAAWDKAQRSMLRTIDKLLR